MKRLALIAILVAAAIMCAGCETEITEAQMLAGIQEAAETGDATAQFMLGTLYAEGKGVANDFSEAKEWFRKAANQGHADAQYSLGVIYSGGFVEPLDLAEGYVWFCLAAKSGVEVATEDCDVLAGELSSEELDAAQKRIDELFEEIQQRT